MTRLLHFSQEVRSTLIRKKQLMGVAAGLFLINFLANFSFMGGFGLYEDDYLLTLPSFDWKARDYLQHIFSAARTWPLGRPGYWIFQDTFAFSLGSFHSLNALHAFTLLATSIAAISLYLTLIRFFNPVPAFLSAVFFILYPADTGKQIFMHQATFALPLITSLAAINFCVSRRPWLCLIFSAFTLLTYEPYFLLIYFSPLLIKDLKPGEALKALLKYAAILTALLICILAIRKWMGDARAADVSGHAAFYLFRAMAACIIGPFTALKICLARPLEAAIQSAPWQWMAIITGAVFIWNFSRYLKNTFPPEMQFPSGRLRALLLALCAGLGMFVATYAYRFYPDYYPPIITIGRLSALHAPGLPGLCIALGAILTFIQALQAQLKALILCLFCLYLGLLTAFSLEVQTSQYVRNWEQQIKFYRDIINLTPDLHDGDIILVNVETGIDPDSGQDDRPTTEGFPPFWMVNYPINILQCLFTFPKEWVSPPRIFGLWSGAVIETTKDGLAIGTPPYYPKDSWPIIRDDKFIYLYWANHELKRASGSFDYNGHILHPRIESQADGVKLLPNKNMYNMFFSQNLGRPLWPGFIKNINYPN
jgi:hypothetical protein